MNALSFSPQGLDSTALHAGGIYLSNRFKTLITAISCVVFLINGPVSVHSQEEINAEKESASGQTTTTSVDSDIDDVGEEIVELSVFTVDASRDVGYRATNTISGTSLNTLIKDLPMSIEVITAEFIDDVGATNFEEALRYSSGVFTEDFPESNASGLDGNNSPGANSGGFNDRSPSSRAGVGGRFGNAIIIRGFNTSFQNRNGFRWGGLIAAYGVTLGGTIDTVNVDRMEVVRGPNSLLYGVGVLSGIVNVLPKRPLPEQRQKFELKMGSNDFFRATADVSGPIKREFLGGELLYRVAGSHEEKGDWTDLRKKDQDYIVTQLEYRGNKRKLNLFFEYQHFDAVINGIGDRHVYDNLVGAVDQTLRNEFGEQTKWTKDVGGLPESFRLTGPDTFHSRKEDDILATLEFTPVKNFSLYTGIFYTKANENEFDINIASITNQERGFNVRVLNNRLLDANTEPEPRALTQAYFDTFVEKFLFEPVLEDPDDVRDPNDYKHLRYWWKNTPTDTETKQFVIRATYNFETPFIGGRAKHTLLVGRQDIKDSADFITGRERIDNQFSSISKDEFSDNDPLLFKSIFDFTPITYNGEALAEPGREYRHVDLWFSGQFAVYQGKFWKDRITFLAGIRKDRYHSRDIEYDRGNFPGDPDDEDSFDEGPGLVVNPDNNTFGFDPFSLEWGPTGTDPENSTTSNLFVGYKFNESLSFYGLVAEGITPNTGVRDGNYVGIPSEQTRSREFGIKFDLWRGKLSGTVAFYKIERDNAVLSWDNAPAPSTWEGGSEPDDGERGDEDTGFRPTVIASGESPLNYGVDSSYFDFNGNGKADDLGTLIVTDPVTGRRSRVFPEGLLATEGEHNGSTNPQNYYYLEYEKLDLPAIDKTGNPTGRPWRYYLEQAFADVQAGVGRSEFREQGGPNDFDPIIYRRTRSTDHGINASEARGANVTFEEEATGFDMQIIYSPKPNWQFIFSYAHTERQATSPLKLVSTADPVSGLNFGTEFDIWVATFGREAYGLEEHDDDGDGVVDRVTKDGQAVGMGDTDPTDLVGGLQGTSLFFGSEDSASLWSKYTFEEGPLRRLQIGGGFNYRGPAATSVAIGGDELLENRFRTPATEAFWRVDALVQYRWRWHEIEWGLKLNIYNLIDDQKGISIVEIDDIGETHFRRTETYHSPRSYRLSLSMSF